MARPREVLQRHGNEPSATSGAQHPGKLPGAARLERDRSGTDPGRRSSHSLAGPQRPCGDFSRNGHPPGEGGLVQCRILAASANGLGFGKELSSPTSDPEASLNARDHPEDAKAHRG